MKNNFGKNYENIKKYYNNLRFLLRILLILITKIIDYSYFHITIYKLTNFYINNKEIFFNWVANATLWTRIILIAVCFSNCE